MLTAVPLLAASLTRDPLLIAGVQVAALLPWLLFSLVAGALVDRLDRRTVMGVVDLARAAVVGALAVAVLFDAAHIALLYAIVFLLGVAETLFDNASQAIMPALVPAEHLERANARLYAAQIVTNQFVGPPLGGFLFAVAAASPFLIDAGSFVVASALVLLIPGAFRAAPAPNAAQRSIRREIVEGLRWLWREPVVRDMAVALGIFNLAYNAATAILVLFALEVLGLDETGYGLLLGVSAVGAFLGSVLAARVSAALGRGRALLAVAIVTGIDLILIAAFPHPAVTAGLLALEGFAGVVWNVITVSLRQSLIPDHLLGRVNSAYRLIGWGTIPIGAFTGGLVARGAGLSAPFYVSGVTTLALGIVLVRRLVPKIEAAGAPERGA